YIVKMVLLSLGVLTLFSVSYWFFMRKYFISPLMRIRGNVTEFAKNETATTISLADIRTKDEMQELAESIHQMENDIVKYIDSIQTITAEKERIGAELSIATQIQADMLPRIFPPFPERHEFDLYATMDPAKEVGGDFYDFFLVDDDHICLVMADVSGKGVPAALFMVIAKTLIKNRAQRGDSPAEILKNVNEQLCEGNEAELFVTVWVAIIEISTGKGLAANAGHEHPVIRRKDGQYELVIYRHSVALAAMEGARFREHPFELYPGDSLFVYTDGVPEATNANNELFGTDRMLTSLNRNPDASPQDLVGTIRRDLNDFVGDAPQFDDITMLGFHYNRAKKPDKN
ncbi:MAG: PP2C family protein-serine/threonine phosphatase, partial [Clostridia bacterium]|nr:PP2C family protein-serine/threonine phosphatase [Clostridia bacterium]